jgi:Holliday junction DNA helicase RuvA subunit
VSALQLAPMIAHLRGTLLTKHPNQAIVETHGVGYEVTISIPTFSEMPAVGSEVALHIHTHVREDALSLYGFLRLGEKHLFEKLLTVSGIGPKLAITILSGMAADEMMTAIRGGDLVRLTRIPGIGKKTAERMVLELRDKLPAATGAEEVSAVQALTSATSGQRRRRRCWRRDAWRGRVRGVLKCCSARCWALSRSKCRTGYACETTQ